MTVIQELNSKVNNIQLKLCKWLGLGIRSLESILTLSKFSGLSQLTKFNLSISRKSSFNSAFDLKLKLTQVQLNSDKSLIRRNNPNSIGIKRVERNQVHNLFNQFNPKTCS